MRHKDPELMKRIQALARKARSTIPDHHPAIVDQETFDAAQAKLTRFKLPNKKAHEYPLKGKVFCGCCRHSAGVEGMSCNGMKALVTELEDWKKQYEPKPEDEKWHPLFLEALDNQDRVDYLLDELMECTADEAKDLIAVHKNEIARYASRVREFIPRPDRTSREAVR